MKTQVRNRFTKDENMMLLKCVINRLDFERDPRRIELLLALVHKINENLIGEPLEIPQVRRPGRPPKS